MSFGFNKSVSETNYYLTKAKNLGEIRQVYFTCLIAWGQRWGLFPQ